MFPETVVGRACFPNVSQYAIRKAVSSVNFCFHEVKFASAAPQNIPCFRAALNHDKTRKQLWKHVSSFCRAFSLTIALTSQHPYDTTFIDLNMGEIFTFITPLVLQVFATRLTCVTSFSCPTPRSFTTKFTVPHTSSTSAPWKMWKLSAPIEMTCSRNLSAICKIMHSSL